MKRRKFIYSAAAAGALPLAAYGHNFKNGETAGRELYELRTYQVKFGSDQKMLKEYLTNILGPALKRLGANFYSVFSEMGGSEPSNLWVLISYPDASVFLKASQVYGDGEYNTAATTYNMVSKDKALYSRFSSSLFIAFEGMPKMMAPEPGASVFELRTYEGFNEDAVSRKIRMFNDEEIALFLKIRLLPVFFGEMIIGPYRPSLTYMLNFKDMAERDATWTTFGSHPEWSAMNSKDIYANSVSNIRKIFLKPL